MLENLSTLVPQLMAAVGVLAFIVSVIIEVIKNIKGLANIPTDLVVLILSVLLTVVAMLAYIQMYAIALTWILIVGAIIGGFFVSFIAMYGWEKFTTLYNRFKQ